MKLPNFTGSYALSLSLALFAVACAPPRAPSTSSTMTTSAQSPETSAGTYTTQPQGSAAAPIDTTPQVYDREMGESIPDEPPPGTGGSPRHDAKSTDHKAKGGDHAVSPGAKITIAIRKSLNDSKTLSKTAKVVKIVTNDGKVTLRGIVKTVQEKDEIERIANSTPGVAQVDDQLEVQK